MRTNSRRAAGAKRSRMGCGSALIIAAVVFVGVTVISAAVYALAPGGVPHVATPFLPNQRGSIRWDGHSRLNVLLLGQNSANQSSAIVVASYRPRSRSVQLLSVPPSLWVTVPGAGQATLGAAYADGGPSLALLLVQNILHVVIPYYAVTDRRTFERSIDDLGGIVLPGGRPPGVVHQLPRDGGAATIAYMKRAGTIQQMWRQQEVMVALLRRSGGPTEMFRLPVLLDALGGGIHTNFPYGQMPALAKLLMAIPNSEIGHHALDYSNNAVSNYVAAGQSVLLPNWQQITAVAQAHLGRFSPAGGTRIQVLNGGGISGQASNLATSLRHAGIRVQKVGSAPSFNYKHTLILTDSHATSEARATARAIATLMQAPLRISQHPLNARDIQVIIGHDFVDPSQQ